MILEFCRDSASTSRPVSRVAGWWPVSGVQIRDAEDEDLDGLEALEARSFVSDRISRRSLRRLIGSGSASLRVAVGRGELQGYHLVLFRKGSSRARLYSIAVDDGHRGSGVGARLLADAEAVARAHGRRSLRLEVREDNANAIRLYQHGGFMPVGRYAAYYAVGADALRYEKILRPKVRSR
jgi:ribosomal protein S18 acetylase RimI-like enzyme